MHRYEQRKKLVCERTKILTTSSTNLLYSIFARAKLKKLDQVKFLGVVIDEDLKYEPHVQHLTQKLKSALRMIKRIITFIPESEYIYDALFKSHLSYCHPLCKITRYIFYAEKVYQATF